DDLGEVAIATLEQISTMSDILAEPHDGKTQGTDVVVVPLTILIGDIAGTAFDHQHRRMNRVVESLIGTEHAAAGEPPGRQARIAGGAFCHQSTTRKPVG